MEAQTTTKKKVQRRDRNVQKIIRMAPEEEVIIKRRMEKANLSNFNLYALLMLMTGEVKNVDLTHYHELAKEVSRVGANINQIVKFANANGVLYEPEIEDLKRGMEDIWQLLKSSLSALR